MIPSNENDWVERERHNPPELTSMRRLRMEQRFMEAVRERQQPWFKRAWAPALGVAFVTAAAFGLVYWGLSSSATPGMRLVWPSHTTAEETWFAQGELLQTQASGATLRFGDSVIEVGPDSSLRSKLVTQDHIVQWLSRGTVTVSFHPDKSRRQKLSIETVTALVEVVGTRFLVNAREGDTTVDVFEGIVRVSPRGGGKAQLLRAGDRIRVERDASVEVKRGTLELEDSVEKKATQAKPEDILAEVAANDGPRSAEEGETPTVRVRGVQRAKESAENVREDEPRSVSASSAKTEAPTGEVDDLVLEVEDDEQQLSLEQLARAKDEAFGIEVHKDPVQMLDRIATLASPERQRHLLYRFVREVRSAEHRGAAWSMVAASWHKQAEHDQALEAYRRARRDGRGTAWELHALFESALLHRARGDRVKAHGEFKAYLDIAPDGYRADQARKYLCSDGFGYCPQ